MKLLEALEVLDAWDRSGRYVFSTGDLARIFGEPRNQPALSGTLTRLVSENVLSRPCRGVYVYRRARSLDATVLARIALVARRGAMSIESFETAASKWGLISQSYARSLSIMTTGRSGGVSCEWGEIALVHTARSASYLYQHSIERPETPLRLADEQLTLSSMKRSGRGTVLAHETRSNPR